MIWSNMNCPGVLFCNPSWNGCQNKALLMQTGAPALLSLQTFIAGGISVGGRQ